MPRIEPPVTDVTERFWDATKDERLLIQWCDACATPIFYPREVCPQCLSADSLDWRQSKGTGTVYAYSVQHRPANPTMADRVPYTVALVELDEGIRMMSNIIDCAPDDVAVGMPVTVAWEDLSDGRKLPQFSPAT
jgi:uncharacterized protein